MDITSSTPILLSTGGAATTTTTNRRRAVGYKFPILKPQEIIQCLKELASSCSDIIVPVLTKEELEEPSHCKEKVRNIFLFLLSYCAGKDESNFQPSNVIVQYVSTLEYSELHPLDSFTEMQFFLSLRKLLEQCLYSEFSWRDLHLPTAKRLRIQLSAIINLVKYLEGEQIKIFNELNGPRSELIQALMEAQAEQDAIKERFLSVEETAQVKRKQMEEVMMECEELEIEIARNNRLQTASRQEAAAVKKKVNDLNDRLQTSIWALQEVEAEEEKLREQVVDNPERYKLQLIDAKTKLQTEKDECTRLEEEIQQCKTKYSNALKVYQDISNCIKDMDELHDEALKYQDMTSKLVNVRKTIEETTKNTAELNERITDNERELARLEDKIKSQRYQHAIKMSAIQESLDTTKRELLQVEKERRDAMARIEKHEHEVQRLHTLIEQERSTAESEITDLITKYKILENKFVTKCQQQLQQFELSGTNDDETKSVKETNSNLLRNDNKENDPIN